MRQLIAAPLAAALAFTSPQAAQAADIRLADDPEYGCLVTLDGVIAPGDTDAMLAVMKRASTESRYADTIWYSDEDGDQGPYIDLKTPLNLCLDSPGGALQEAVALTQAVHGRLGTMIRPGARCESACALVFMAGSYDTGSDIGTVTSRHLHVDGRLGFHAPSLTVPDGNYSAETVAKAYQVSVEATALIFRNLVAFRFPPSLAAKMHQTPPQDMFHISTVQEAARWGISVIGIDPPSQVSDPVIKTACANLYRATMDLQTSNPDVWHLSGDPNNRVNRDTDTFSYQGFGMEAVGTCQGRFINRSDEYNIARNFWGPARAVQASVWGEGSFPDAEPPLFFSLMQNYMAYPPEIPLIALPRNGQTFTIDRPGTCFVYNRDDALTDQEPCTQSRSVLADGTLQAVHHWPSGARTVVETAGLVDRINGAATGSWYWPDPRPKGAEDRCPRSESSGNTFCFHPD
ncbi:hypothetical protein ANTHELSMS3_02948 [Antarctobacter heliothermus]|uniref:Lipoprotein n=1 Tax=Antarctobacter heliothermus TaxID=74033 RepID=A0A222E6P3_9RHOB|nr:hypothetical protein [Antarctobacter heliothermus]ASP21601.1 hypothetical protein ANTHELSMS3_02948 [Antarctobacter heliothermus]